MQGMAAVLAVEKAHFPTFLSADGTEGKGI